MSVQNRRSRLHDFKPRRRFGLLTLVVTLALSSPVGAAKKKGGGGGKKTLGEISIEVELRSHPSDNISGNGIFRDDESGVDAFLFGSRNFSFTIDPDATSREVNLDFTTAQSPPQGEFPCQLQGEEPFLDAAAHFDTFSLAVNRTDPQECESVAGSGPGVGLLCLNPGEEARTGLRIEWEGDPYSYLAAYAELVTEEEVFEWQIDVVRCTENAGLQPPECDDWPGVKPPSWNATWIFTPHVPNPTPPEMHTFLRVNRAPLEKPKGKPVDPEFIGLCALDFQIRVSCIDETQCPCFDSNGSVVPCSP